MFKSATVDRASAKSSNTSPFHREKESEAFIQPKLNIGKSSDKYEVEADSVADKVVNKTTINGESSFFSPALMPQKRGLQRQEETEEIQEKPIAQSITPVVQLAAIDEEPVQGKPSETIQKQEEDVQKQDEASEETIQTKTENPNYLFITVNTDEIQKPAFKINFKNYKCWKYSC